MARPTVELVNCCDPKDSTLFLTMHPNWSKPAKRESEPRINQTLGLQEGKSGLQEISTPRFVYLYQSVHTSVFLLERRWFSFQILLCHQFSHTNHRFEIRIDVVFAQFPLSFFLCTTRLWNWEVCQSHSMQALLEALYAPPLIVTDLQPLLGLRGQKVAAEERDGATKKRLYM